MTSLCIRPVDPGDSAWVADFVESQWGAPLVVAHGARYYPHTLPGFVAIQDRERVGLITYRVRHRQCEIVTLNSLSEGQGIGTALIEAVVSAAKEVSIRDI
jgi:DNA-3-methyladenine glycosylase I